MSPPFLPVYNLLLSTFYFNLRRSLLFALSVFVTCPTVAAAAAAAAASTQPAGAAVLPASGTSYMGMPYVFCRSLKSALATRKSCQS